MDTLNSQIKFLLKPILILFVLLILIVVSMAIGINQYSSIKSKIDESKTIQVGLNKKLSVLQTVPESISGDTTFLDVALPQKTAVLYGTSQIRLQAAKGNLLVSNIKTGASTSESGGISKSLITFDVEGDEVVIYDFLQSFSKVLPLMNINRIKLSKAASITRANVQLNVYSAELPKTIPSLSSSVNELSADEINTLKEISTYALPAFIEPEAQITTAKPDPFN